MKRILRVALVFAWLCAWLEPVNGQEEGWLEGLPLSNEQLLLATEYVSAVNAKDIGKIILLHFPDRSECADDERVDQSKDPFAGELDIEVPELYEVAVEKWENTGLSEIEKLLGGEFLVYPVVPTYKLKIGWVRTGGGTIITRPIVNTDGKWYLATSCPTKVFSRFKELQVKGRK